MTITKIQVNSIQGIAYHQNNLLQEKTTHHILGEIFTVKNNNSEALKDHNKEKVNISRVKIANNASITQNDVLLTLIQYIEALT